MNSFILSIFLFVSIAYHAQASLWITYQDYSAPYWTIDDMEQSAIQFPMDIANPQNNPLVILLPYDKAVKLSADMRKMDELVTLIRGEYYEPIFASFKDVKNVQQAEAMMNKFLGNFAIKTNLVNLAPEYAGLKDKDGKEYQRAHDNKQIQGFLGKLSGRKH